MFVRLNLFVWWMKFLSSVICHFNLCILRHSSTFVHGVFNKSKKNIKKDKGKKIRVWTQWFFFFSEYLECFVSDIIKGKWQKERFPRKKPEGSYSRIQTTLGLAFLLSFINRKNFLSMVFFHFRIPRILHFRHHKRQRAEEKISAKKTRGFLFTNTKGWSD